MSRSVPKRLRANARAMRRKMTDAELQLWNALRAHRLMGLGFRRQMPIARFIVDFTCPEHRLIIEIDGSQHGREAEMDRDRRRTERLAAHGWRVVRFWNDDVLRDIDGVCSHILTMIAEG
ncbi:endonuclease domain-containing protein [Consotaella aegiceratis]|uniref:endonuclease domain-containing protein n=1 Tax=Consotaella aegiceratis TaxID=3097961 RepID=UPI002F3F1342